MPAYRILLPLLAAFLLLLPGLSHAQPSMMAEPAGAAAETTDPTVGDSLLPDEQGGEFDFDEEEFWDASGNEKNGTAAKADIAAMTPDPLEPWNRFWFAFNDNMYLYLLDPVARGWEYVVPEKPRTWINNFFHNLAAPVRVVNCLLQGKFFKAGVEFSRFVGNTAFGLGGLGDVTGGLKPLRPIPPGEEDFGQTLGMWGFDNGCYLVWPVFGSSSIRDTVGLGVDMWLDPSWYLDSKYWYYSIAGKVVQQVNAVSFRLDEYQALRDASLDPYIAFRDAYLRYRAQKVAE